MISRILTIAVLLISIVTLPDSFSWGSQGTRNYLGPVLNQNNPHRCESSWAIATANVLSARINIAMAKMKFFSSSVSLSSQSLLQCDNLNFGCLGGDPAQALRWILRNNLTDSSCNSYKAKGYTNGLRCSSQSRCQACWAKDACKGQINSKIYSFKDIVAVGGEEGIASEILNSGPVVCGVSATSEFKAYSKGIFQDKTGTYNHNHYVLVYGWGVEAGVKYWLIQNSYGPTWGEDGSLRLIRGKNNLGIEALCYAASPVDTWTRDIRNGTLPNQMSKLTQFEHSAPLPLSSSLTTSLSQLTPNYCDVSWAFAVVHALSDGELMRSNGTSVRSFSVQALLNCGVGSCEKGGNPHDVLAFINKYGVSEEGCQQYQSEPPAKESCTSIDSCSSCSGNSIFKDNCTDVKGYKRWKIYNYGSVSGKQDMSRELLNHHALICGIEATSNFKAYSGNVVFSQISISPKINHWVELVGEGTEGGTAYWLGRNSWGTTWGNGGFFKIKKGGQNLGVQSKCYWAGNIS